MILNEEQTELTFFEEKTRSDNQDKIPLHKL